MIQFANDRTREIARHRWRREPQIIIVHKESESSVYSVAMKIHAIFIRLLPTSVNLLT